MYVFITPYMYFKFYVQKLYGDIGSVKICGEKGQKVWGENKRNEVIKWQKREKQDRKDNIRCGLEEREV